MEGRYYWLKLPKDFFKRHDIAFIKSLPEGHKIALFYLELMLESVDHEGELRFSQDIPYNVQMLASVTNSPADVVETSMKVLVDLGMIVIDEDGTIRLPKVIKMIGSASDSDEARRSKRYRERKKAERDETSHENVTPVTECVTKRHESKSKSKSIEKELDIDKREIVKRKFFIKPTLDEVHFYCKERNNGIDALKFYDYYESKGWMIGKNPMKDWKAAVRTWERNNIDKKEVPENIENPFTKLKREEGWI